MSAIGGADYAQERDFPVVDLPVGRAVAGGVLIGSDLLYHQRVEQNNMIARQQVQLQALVENHRKAQLNSFPSLNTAQTDVGDALRLRQQLAYRTLADNNADKMANLTAQLVNARKQLRSRWTNARTADSVAYQFQEQTEQLLREDLMEAIKQFRLEQLELAQQNHAEQVALIEAQEQEQLEALGLVLQ
jgi:hypothetical protein